jgi:hypothetical protein
MQCVVLVLVQVVSMRHSYLLATNTGNVLVAGIMFDSIMNRPHDPFKLIQEDSLPQRCCQGAQRTGIWTAPGHWQAAAPGWPGSLASMIASLVCLYLVYGTTWP